MRSQIIIYLVYRNNFKEGISMNKTIGIIGGMGPLATMDLYRKIIEVTPAHSDNDHIHVVIDSNTLIPDRTAYILGKGKDPAVEMIRSAISLENMGADFLIMACNTAHFYYDRITPFVKIPILNMIEETAKEINNLEIKTVGLLATDGVLTSKVYHGMLKEYGIKILQPNEDGQKEVMNLIYNGIKASNYSIDTSRFERVIEELYEAGAETLILGCTELPIAFERFKLKGNTIDPTKILARSAVKFALGH